VGRYNLIRDLHAQKLTVPEIKEHLAAGKTSNGQAVKLTISSLYLILKKMKLKPHRFSLDYLSLQRTAAEFRQEGRSFGWIARHFNKEGFASASGKPWTRQTVYGLHLVHKRRL
jgi:hypothetical protein